MATTPKDQLSDLGLAGAPDGVDPASFSPPGSGKGPLILRPMNVWRSGLPMVWVTGTCAALVLLLFVTLVLVVAVNGLGTYWASDIAALHMKDGTQTFGTIKAKETSKNRLQIYTGNRDVLGLDFRWIDSDKIESIDYPEDIVLLERIESGNFIGRIEAVIREGERIADGDLWQVLAAERRAMANRAGELHNLERKMGRINRKMERLRLESLKLGSGRQETRESLEAQRLVLGEEFESLNRQLVKRRADLRTYGVQVTDSRGSAKEIAILDIIRAYRPNHMTIPAKLRLYTARVWELLSGNPRESNTEGGLFPAIFGTVMMVMLMSLFGVPLGVVTAVYLREYAKDGFLVNLVRIAVNNLAGVPSIVYGIFGLGFFVYGLGGTLDQFFFSERLPLPTFGTGGLLWASMTMALLTVPVVIVSTEEGLNSVPQGVRDGSIALGATKLQTLTRVVLPMATPGVLTGLILSIARAAGEVAPLMLVGVVKIVPSLPLDGNFPYLHAERKFMHLGFHIYDVGFQSPNVEAAMPMVYVTTLLLLVLVLGMSFTAMFMRNKMKKRYASGTF